MSLKLYELNDTSGVTCKECLGKTSLVVSNTGASSSTASHKDCFQLDDSRSFPENVTGRLEPLNNDMQSTERATTEGGVENFRHSGLIFLFEKRLTPADCDLKAGRLLLPRLDAEKLISRIPKKTILSIVIEEIGGKPWELTLRWWRSRMTRKYILGGTRECCQKMKWNVGDMLIFYRRISEGKLVMKLQKV